MQLWLVALLYNNGGHWHKEGSDCKSVLAAHLKLFQGIYWQQDKYSLNYCLVHSHVSHVTFHLPTRHASAPALLLPLLHCENPTSSREWIWSLPASTQHHSPSLSCLPIVGSEPCNYPKMLAAVLQSVSVFHNRCLLPSRSDAWPAFSLLALRRPHRVNNTSQCQHHSMTPPPPNGSWAGT